MSRRGLAPLCASLLLAATASAGQGPPRLTNARLSSRSAASGLQEVAAGIVAGGGGAQWIGYAVPLDGPQSMCCWESVESVGHTPCPGCRLEGKGPFTVGSGPDDAVRLEADDTMVVMLRAQDGRISRLRTVSWSCALDAGSLPVSWLEDVRPSESVRLLASLLHDDTPSRELMNGALLALAMHAEPSALDVLIDAARRDASSKVRAQALFWLSQKAGQRAVAAIAHAVDDDPESQVRERAVFALSQLPRDDGVPRLLALARSHRDPRVREKAMFWLGQSGDPRALAFFEEVLRR